MKIGRKNTECYLPASLA